MDKGEAFEYFIRELEGRLEKLRAIKQMLAIDPGLDPDLTRILAWTGGEGKTMSARSGANPSDNPMCSKIITFLKSKSPDDWVRAREIAEKTGIQRHNVYLTLDRFSTYFDKDVRGPKTKLFRLKLENR